MATKKAPVAAKKAAAKAAPAKKKPAATKAQGGGKGGADIVREAKPR